MSNSNYKCLFYYKLREYDNQPPWTIYCNDDTRHPITVKDVGILSLLKRTDYNVLELHMFYYKRRGNVEGECYCYSQYNKQLMDEIILENETTHKKYNITEYEEFGRTHPLEEGGYEDTIIVSVNNKGDDTNDNKT